MGEQNLLYLCNESENQNSASYKFLGMDQSACSYKLFGLNAFLDRQTFHYIKYIFFFYLVCNYLVCNFQKRGIEGCVVSNESIGVVAVSLWEPMRLHLSWPRRDRDCGCGMLRSSQLRGDPVPNRSSACDF